MRAFIADVRYCVRNLRHSPAFFGLVIGILALGVAASVSIFSLVDGVALRPLPYRDPQRLFALTSFASRPPFDANGSLSYHDFQQIKADARSFTDVAVTYRTGWSRVTLTGGAEPIFVQGAFVSPNLFGLFGRKPMLGRTFSDEENRRAERVVVISRALWSQRFGSSRDAIGRDLEIGHARWRVIGVMPADFQVPFLDTQLWAPVLSHPDWLDPEHTNPHDQPFWDVYARLRPGVSVNTGQAELNSLWSGLRRASPDFHENDIRLIPLREHFAGSVRKPMFILFASVASLLLIACANVGNLLLAKAARREREIAVRSALGAGTGRLVRQLLAEGLTVAIIAGLAGTAAACLLVPALKSVAPASTPLLSAVTLNVRSLLFALALVLITGVLLGLAPASRISRLTLVESLSSAGRGITESKRARRLKGLLVASEFALAMVLLTGAALLIRSFVAVLNVNTGFQPEHVLTVDLSVPLPPDQSMAFYRDAMNRIAALPGVRSVGGAGTLFYLDETRTHALRLVEGHSAELADQWKPLVWNHIAGDYFESVGIPLLAGRFFNAHDGPDSAPVVIVNQTLAKRYWPGQNPVGKRVKGFDPRGKHDDWLTVVGVVADARVGGLEKPPFSEIYEAEAQRPGEPLHTLTVRGSGNIAGLPDALRRTIHSVNRDAVISSAMTMQMLLAGQETSRRFQTWLISLFSALALALAAFGVFGVMHYSVAARTGEIGIRMAVGASRGDVVRLVLASGAIFAGTGIAAGALGAMWLTRIIAGLLFAIGTGDPISFSFAALTLFCVSLVATFLPAYRASRIDPMIALRHE